MKELEKTEQMWRHRIELQRHQNQTAQTAIVEQILKSTASNQEGQALCRRIQRAETLSNQMVHQPVESKWLSLLRHNASLLFDSLQHIKIAKAENRNARLSMDKEQIDGDVYDQKKTLERQQRDVQEHQRRVEQVEHQCDQHEKLLAQKENQLVHYRTSVQELRLTLQKNPCRSEEERQLKAVKEQLEQSDAAAETLQRQWHLAQQYLISIATIRDQQAAQQENLRDGNIIDILHPTQGQI